jgi:hypothetical protein
MNSIYSHTENAPFSWCIFIDYIILITEKWTHRESLKRYLYSKNADDVKEIVKRI